MPGVNILPKNCKKGEQTFWPFLKKVNRLFWPMGFWATKIWFLGDQNLVLGDPPKVVILIQNTISKFLKNKNQTQIAPLKFQKIKNIYKEASNQKFYKTDPSKVGFLIQS